MSDERMRRDRELGRVAKEPAPCPRCGGPIGVTVGVGLRKALGMLTPEENMVAVAAVKRHLDSECQSERERA